MVRDFKGLKVWQESFSLAKEIYKITFGFPKEEIYGMTSQIRRASLSVCSNIAEGCGRKSNREFVNFLYIATGSLREVECQLMLSNELGYFDEDKFNKLKEDINRLSGMLMRFIYNIPAEK